jgi:glycosyltransferase involved in cell wall biosynthesis
VFSNANLVHMQNRIEALELRGERKKILILLAAYNGEKYLSEQIQSIQGQTISNWTLLVRDDGSDDHSKDIIEDFAARDPRIRLLHDEREGRGTTKNFAALMQVALAEGADAIFFSDQDDIWLPHKIARQLQSLHEMEWQYAPGTPLLCYSDLEVVDQELHQIHPSFMRYEKLRHESQNPIHVLLTQNLVTGCAVVINRDLLEFVTPIPNEVNLHDWWLAICAAACGRIGYIDEPLVQYRQHSTNQIGALTVDRLVNLSAVRKRLSNIQDYMLGPISQAKVLSDRIREEKVNCSDESLELLDGFISCLGQSTLRRLWTIYQLPLRRQGLWRKLLLFLRLLLMRNEPKVKFTQYHDPLDAGVLLRMKPKTSGTLSETNRVWPGLAARNRRRRVVNARSDEKGM